jgi:hypothetical protein
MPAQSKIPKPVQRARELLREQGLVATGANIKHALGKDELNKLASAFRNTMGDEAKAGYKQLKTDEERRSWLAQYVIDPHTAVSKGFNSTVAFVSAKQSCKSGWVTEAQLGGPLYLNDTAAAKIMVESGELQSRPHESQALAAEGAKQYYYSAAVDVSEAGIKEHAGVSTSAELNANEFQEVRDHITNNFGKAGKRKTSKPKEPETEASKRLKAAATLRCASLRKLKALCDKIHNDLTAAEKDVQKLEEKGYPEQMQNFLLGKIEEVRGCLRGAQQVYAEEAMKPDPKAAGDADGLEAEGQKVDGAINTLDKQYQVYRKSAGADIKKLTS